MQVDSSEHDLNTGPRSDDERRERSPRSETIDGLKGKKEETGQWSRGVARVTREDW